MVEEWQSYIGLTILSTSCNIFNYDIKAGNIGNMILATRSVIGKLPPWENLHSSNRSPSNSWSWNKSQYNHINPWRNLEDIQHLFLCQCRLLNVGEKCMNAILFTETAVIQVLIKYRRIITALKYLKYLLQLPPDLYAAHAMRDSISLASMGKPCWIMDILYVLEIFHFKCIH